MCYQYPPNKLFISLDIFSLNVSFFSFLCAKFMALRARVFSVPQPHRSFESCSNTLYYRNILCRLEASRKYEKESSTIPKFQTRKSPYNPFCIDGKCLFLIEITRHVTFYLPLWQERSKLHLKPSKIPSSLLAALIKNSSFFKKKYRLVGIYLSLRDRSREICFRQCANYTLQPPCNAKGGREGRRAN